VSSIQFFDDQLSAPKGHTFGTHRTRDPDRTLTEYLPLANRMGITRLANITGLDSIGLPTYTAIRPNSRSLATSQGKGIDAASAKVSALMESIESWHAENVELPLRYDSYASLCQRAPVIDIAQLLTVRNRIVHADQPRLWIRGWDLIQHRATYVPFDCVTLYFFSDGSVTPTPFVQSSTGLASGNHLLEALTHGLCEAIERDCEVLWLESETVQRVDPKTVDDEQCLYVLGLLERAGVHVAIWDMTSDIGVPAYSCAIMERPDPAAWRRQGAYSGYGCHLERGIALLRALTEAVQSRVTFIAGSRDDMHRRDYVSLQLDEAQRMRWSEMIEADGLQTFSRTASQATPSFHEDVTILLERLVKSGLNSAVAVDLTKPEIGIPVVKVVVPGLEESGRHIQVGARGLRARKSLP
jgi:YcaO-like protein with predicted kinase domain